MKFKRFAISFGKLIRRSVKKWDLFTQNIMFTYKGETTFSTFLGGSLSIAIFTLIIVYGIFLFEVMINKQNSNNSQSTEVIDLTTNDENYYIRKNNGVK